VNKQGQLQAALEVIKEEVADIQGAVLASRDGLAIASTLGSAEASRVAAMAATVLGLGERVVQIAELGQLEETVVQSELGVFIVYRAGDLALLAVLARVGANLGLINIEARRAAEAVANTLSAYREAVRGAEPVDAVEPAASVDDDDTVAADGAGEAVGDSGSPTVDDASRDHEEMLTA
jgi:hypothetical protein